MNSKMQNQKSLESASPIASSDLELLKDEELEARAGLDDLLKNLSSSRGKVARWAAVAALVVGNFVGMVMPAHAVNRARCESETFNIVQGPRGDRATMCFANRGEILVGIADVHRLYSGNNGGFVVTNKGNFNFGKHQVIDFINTVGTVTISTIHIN
ncbi:beta/gamma crystallin domain-containing protein [Rivularia sp. UHCC 0363]|uniref:beta/gamma crystallin domain-containing protein n=1 Tax=Rivularia sp. UHCC 0363 TaxID=3110244 RepID=UPI002B1F25FB|nr:beta/gamma crystallin domain-containing protein [Rivularia sp. UHCC 0363]MEA5598989.1 beta/gamma crystallin domain-containing protein [Rivularia sp. UHCC 0363]